MRKFSLFEIEFLASRMCPSTLCVQYELLCLHIGNCGEARCHVGYTDAKMVYAHGGKQCSLTTRNGTAFKTQLRRKDVECVGLTKRHPPPRRCPPQSQETEGASQLLDSERVSL
jgi:hypothetical protein